MGTRTILMTVVALVAAMLGGCVSAGPEVRPSSSGVHANLVTPSPMMLELAETADDGAVVADWEASRNDPVLRTAGGIPDLTAFGLVEGFDQQRLRISNGRSREYSIFRQRVHVRHSER